jgi:signal transduction histidine kinase
MATHPHDRVSLRDVLHQAVEATRAELERSGCKLELLLPADLPMMEGDAGALQRAFENLLSNASKHGAAGGWIGVHVARIQGSNGERAEISVRDRGPGIPLAEQASIFDPFYRGEQARRENRRGVGLGLSLVREIVRAHGGEVTVRSEPGHGAEFCVRLPALATTSPQ